MIHSQAPDFSSERMTIPPGHAWNRVPLIGAVAGVAGLAASLLLASRDPAQFYFSWLVAFLFYISLALGGLFFVLSHFVTGASWSVVVRRVAEHVMGSLPWFIPLFLPIFLGMGVLYHWSDPQAVMHDALLRGKRSYLNTSFFLLRAGVYLGSWALLSAWFLKQSQRQDQTGERAITSRLIRASAPALFVFAITVSFATIDWAMSLDPHWYSTMIGVYFFSGCVVGIFALLILLGAALCRAGLMTGALSVEHFHDLGKLLFGFTVFWAYIAFCQFFLIWYGNIPEETLWYMHRTEGSWKPVALLLAAGHFVVPFFFLMPRTIKRRTGLLVLGAVWMLLMHFVDIYWLVMPTHHTHGLAPSLLDLTTLVGIGGVFLFAVSWPMRRHALMPIGDPRLAESLSFENV